MAESYSEKEGSFIMNQSHQFAYITNIIAKDHGGNKKRPAKSKSLLPPANGQTIPYWKHYRF